MKVLDILPLLWLTQTLTSCGAQNTTDIPSGTFNLTTQEVNSTVSHVTALSDVSPTESTSLATSTAEVSTVAEGRSSQRTSVKPSTIRTPDPTEPKQGLYRQQCLPLLMISGGLILAAVILLITTLLLTWKVCQLKSRLKTLSSDADLISNCEYWMGSAQRRKNPSVSDAKDTVLLLDRLRLPLEEARDVTGEENAPEVALKTEEKKSDGPLGPEEEEDVPTQMDKTDPKLPEVAAPASSAP